MIQRTAAPSAARPPTVIVVLNFVIAETIFYNRPPALYAVTVLYVETSLRATFERDPSLFLFR